MEREGRNQVEGKEAHRIAINFIQEHRHCIEITNQFSPLAGRISFSVLEHPIVIIRTEDSKFLRLVVKRNPPEDSFAERTGEQGAGVEGNEAGSMILESAGRPQRVPAPQTALI